MSESDTSTESVTEIIDLNPDPTPTSGDTTDATSTGATTDPVIDLLPPVPDTETLVRSSCITAVGQGAQASGYYSMAFGDNAVADGDFAVTITDTVTVGESLQTCINIIPHLVQRYYMVERMFDGETTKASALYGLLQIINIYKNRIVNREQGVKKYRLRQP